MNSPIQKNGPNFGLGPLSRPSTPPSISHLATFDPMLAGLAPCMDFRETAKGTKHSTKAAKLRPSQIKGIVLHSTGKHYQRTPLGWYEQSDTNFVIPANGIINYNQDVLEEHDGVLKKRGLGLGWVGVEFIGEFKTVQHFYKSPKKQTNKDKPTIHQVLAGRRLIMWLKRRYNITEVIAHRHMDGGMGTHKNNRKKGKRRFDDPGPGIWYNVGHWAIQKHGLKEGKAFHVTNNRQDQKDFQVPKSWKDSSNLLVDF